MPVSMSDDESLRELVEAQERRIEELEARQASQTRRKRHHPHRVWIVLLLALGTLLTPITFTALFVHTQISNTGRYVQNIKPLASDPAIQAYVADQVTTSLFNQVDIDSYVRDALPPRAERLVGPLTSALRGFVQNATLRVLQSPQFRKLWAQANRVAHAQLVDVLTGNGKSAITTSSNGQVTVDLSAVTSQVTKQLHASGIDLFSHLPIVTIGGKITVFRSKELYKARQATDVLNVLAFVLPFVVVACFGGAILLSHNKRRGFLAAAVGFAVGALILAIALAVGRHFYLDAATNANFPYDAASSVYDTLVRFLHTAVRAALLFSIAVIVAVFLAGPSRSAKWFRLQVRTAANFVGHESDRAGWTLLGSNAFVARHKGKLRAAVAVVAFIVLFRWQQPTPGVIFWVAVVTVIALALVEFFGREPVERQATRREAPYEVQMFLPT
jgi:hypothetical protein